MVVCNVDTYVPFCNNDDAGITLFVDKLYENMYERTEKLISGIDTAYDRINYYAKIPACISKAQQQEKESIRQMQKFNDKNLSTCMHKVQFADIPLFSHKKICIGTKGDNLCNCDGCVNKGKANCHLKDKPSEKRSGCVYKVSRDSIETHLVHCISTCRAETIKKDKTADKNEFVKDLLSSIIYDTATRPSSQNLSVVVISCMEAFKPEISYIIHQFLSSYKPKQQVNLDILISTFQSEDGQSLNWGDATLHRRSGTTVSGAQKIRIT